MRHCVRSRKHNSLRQQEFLKPATAMAVPAAVRLGKLGRPSRGKPLGRGYGALQPPLLHAPDRIGVVAVVGQELQKVRDVNAAQLGSNT